MDTKTTTIETQIAEATTTTENNNVKEVNNILFLAFAEFLGYESPLIDWVDTLCKGTDIALFKKRILQIESSQIFEKMKEKYTIAQIKKWWDEYYPLILEGYKENLDKIKSELPF